MIDELRQDITFALRQLRKAPAFTLIAAATLALGIGANSAIFALVDATLLRPLPYASPERLVTIWETSAATPRGFASPPNMIDWETRGRTFEKIAGYIPSMGSMVMAGNDGNALTVSRQWVSAGIFDVLGVQPIAGRTFTAEDEQQRANVVVLSEGLWETRFNRDPGLVGQEIRLDGQLWRVTGIMPKRFEILGRTSMWAMRPFAGMPPRARAAYHAAGGWTTEARRWRGSGASGSRCSGRGIGARVSGVQQRPHGDRRAVARHDDRQRSEDDVHAVPRCGRVRAVDLLRATWRTCCWCAPPARTRELAVRSALGAGRRRIVRQLLTESLVLSLIGGALGMAVGAAILRVAPVMIPEGLLPATVALSFDMRVVAFCATASLLVGVLFGIAPAWHAMSFSSPEVGSDSRTTTGGGGRLRNLFVVGEVAMAVLLLFGAGLLLRTLIAVSSYDRGYRAESVLTMLVDPLGSAYPTPEKLQQFFDQVEAEVRAVPGVADVGWSTALPLGESIFGEYPFHYEIVGDAPVDAGRKPTTAYQIVSPTYFSTLELPIVAGRAFDTRDSRGNPRVVIVNEAFARSLGGRNPIGLQVSFKPG